MHFCYSEFGKQKCIEQICNIKFYIRLAYQNLCILEMKILSFQKMSAAKYFEIGWIDFLEIFTYVSWDPYLPLLLTIFLLSMKII